MGRAVTARYRQEKHSSGNAMGSYAKVKRCVEMFSKGEVKYRAVEYGNGLDKQRSAKEG